VPLIVWVIDGDRNPHCWPTASGSPSSVGTPGSNSVTFLIGVPAWSLKSYRTVAVVAGESTYFTSGQLLIGLLS
jgi:hypothetical protein